MVKLADPQRAAEIKMLTVAGALFFIVFLVYSWQHFRAIEYGYRIEAQRIHRDQLIEQNRELNLQEAGLRDPERIDYLAHKMGLTAPHAGQIVNLDSSTDNTQTVMASALPAPSVGTR